MFLNLIFTVTQLSAGGIDIGSQRSAYRCRHAVFFKDCGKAADISHIRGCKIAFLDRVDGNQIDMDRHFSADILFHGLNPPPLQGNKPVPE